MGDVHALDQFLKQRLQTDWPAPKRKPKRPQSSLIRRPPTADSERPKPLTEQQRKRLAQKEALNKTRNGEGAAMAMGIYGHNNPPPGLAHKQVREQLRSQTQD